MTALALWLAAVDRRTAPPARAGTAAADVGDVLLAQQDRVRRLVHRLLGWPARAGEVDDVVQDVLLAAWRRRATFRGDASVATWLCRIAVRKAQNHARWRAVRARCMPFFGDVADVPGQTERCGSRG